METYYHLPQFCRQKNCILAEGSVCSIGLNDTLQLGYNDLAGGIRKEYSSQEVILGIVFETQCLIKEHLILLFPIQYNSLFFNRTFSLFKTTKLTEVSTCRLVANTGFTSCPKERILAATAEAYFTLIAADPNNRFLAISRPICKMLSVSA